MPMILVAIRKVCACAYRFIIIIIIIIIDKCADLRDWDAFAMDEDLYEISKWETYAGGVHSNL